MPIVQFDKPPARVPRRGAELLRHRRCPRHRRRVRDARARRAARQGVGALVGPRPRLRRPRHARVRRGARGGVCARRRIRRRLRRARGRRADTGGRAASARSRRRDHRVAQPARVQRRQVLRPRRAQAERRRGGGDRGAARRARARRRRDRRTSTSPSTAISSTCSSASAPTCPGLRIAVDCANGCVLRTSRRARSNELGAEVEAIGNSPTARTSTSAAARPTSRRCSSTSSTGRVRPRHRVRRRRRPHARGRRERRTRSTATRSSRSSRSHLGVDLVAVTTMTNLGFHRLMEERGIRVITTDVGDRYVLEALYREGGDPRRRAVRAHHLPARPRHRRRPRVGAAALRGARRPEAVRGRRGDGALPAGQAESAARGPRPAARSAARADRRGECRARRRAAACSCGRPARSPSSACSPRPRRRRRPKASVLGSPRS